MLKDSKNPLLSFVVPVFNKSAYLAECLETLINQTVKDIEIVVVDDGSTDSVEYLRKHYTQKDNRISWYTLPENKGRSYARNFGNKKAKANIIAVMDADDLAVNVRVDRILKYFKKHPKCDIFYSGFVCMDMFGRTTDVVEAVEFDLNRVKETGVTHMGHSTMAYKKDVILKVKYDEGEYSDLGLDDWKLQMDLSTKGYKYGYSTEKLIYYRVLSDSIVVVRNATKAWKAKGRYWEGLK